MKSQEIISHFKNTFSVCVISIENRFDYDLKIWIVNGKTTVYNSSFFLLYINTSNLSEDIKMIYTIIFASLNGKTTKKKKKRTMYTDEEFL